MSREALENAKRAVLSHGWQYQVGDEGDLTGLVVRPQREIVDRMMIMHACAAAACGYPRERALAWILQQGLGSTVVEWEDQFLKKGFGRPVDFAGSVESIWAMAWSVGIVPELLPTSPCPDTFVKLLPDLWVDAPSDDVRAKARKPDSSSVIEALIMMRVLDRRIYGHMESGGRIPRKTHLFAILARQKALEWICTKGEWDAMVWWRVPPR